MWWKKITFYNYFFIATILSILTAIGIFFVKGILPPVVPLLYGRPTGNEQLIPFWYLFLVPGVSILITFINLVANMSVKDVFVKKILAIGAFIISVMATITIIKVVFLVGFI